MNTADRNDLGKCSRRADNQMRPATRDVPLDRLSQLRAPEYVSTT
jgi:hypothetical protein